MTVRNFEITLLVRGLAVMRIHGRLLGLVSEVDLRCFKSFGFVDKL